MARNTLYELFTIGTVDTTYKNVWGFSSSSERDTFLSNKLSRSLNSNKYWRMGNSIRIPVTFEDSYKYDYVRITNRPESENKQVFYCFITGRQYINLNLTELILDIDWIQTYYFDGITPFYEYGGVITKTTENVSIPKGMQPEYPVMQRYCQNYIKQLITASSTYEIVIYSTIDISGVFTPPKDTTDEKDIGSFKFNYPLDENVIYRTSTTSKGIASATTPYIITSTSVQNKAYMFTHIITALNSNGRTDAISGVYAIPKWATNLIRESDTSIENNHCATCKVTFVSKVIEVPKPSNCNGYIPVNKELIDGGYTTIQINNYQGEVVEYRFDEFNGNPRFELIVNISGGYPQLALNPLNLFKSYNTNNQTDVQFVQKITTPISESYLNDSYAIWLAQTQNSRAVTYDEAVLNLNQAKEAQQRMASWQSELDNYLTSSANLMKQSLSDYTDRVQNRIDSYRDSFSDSSNLLDRLIHKANPIDEISKALTFNPLTEQSFNKAVGIIEPANKMLSSVGNTVIDFASWFARKQLGIEQAYLYNQAVEKAQFNVDNWYKANVADKAFLTGTAKGSNTYGDLASLFQWDFCINIIAPSYDDAERIDKLISASGHRTFVELNDISKSHTIFDYYEGMQSYLPMNPNRRPNFVTNLMRQLLVDGFYIWWLITPFSINNRFGTPYGLLNNEA